MADSDHIPAHSHILLVRGGASRMDGAPGMPSSLHGGNVAVGYLHKEGDG